MQTVSRSQRCFPEQARIPSPSRAVPKAHQIFRHARPRQFTASGRKRRSTQERDRRAAQALSLFDQGAGVWASLKTILRELRAMEARRDPDDQATWSLATLKRSLARLEASGVERRHGIHHEGRKKWGTRERTLHPERLLPRSECEPSIRSNVNRRSLECEPLEVKDFNTSGSPAKNHHPNLNQKNDDDSHRKGFLKPTPKSQPKISGREKQKPKTYQERLAQFKADAKAAILHDGARVNGCQLRDGDKPIPQVVDEFLDDIISRADNADTVICSANYLITSFQNFMESDTIIEGRDQLRHEQKQLSRDQIIYNSIFESQRQAGWNMDGSRTAEWLSSSRRKTQAPGALCPSRGPRRFGATSPP